MQHLGLNLLEKDDFEVTCFDNLYTGENRECHFHGFPQTRGWEFDTSTYTIKKPIRTPGVDFGQLMQSWLFFGLITAVVYDDNHDETRRFDSKTLVSKRNTIDTTELPRILREWQRWEMQKKNESGQNMRMIRAQLALDLARKVIKRHSPPPGSRRKAGPTQLDDHLALSLMVLGETLTNAKAKIINQVGFRARDWYGDADIGWGSPSAVLDKMDDDDWCPRTKNLLRAQLRENATALLSVYISHRQHKFRGHTEAKCNEDEPCKLKSEDGRFPGEYATKHHPDCLHRGNRRNAACHPGSACCGQGDEDMKDDEETYELPTCLTPCVDKMVGVTIADVVRIIEADRIPLIKFKETKGGEDPIQLEVIDDAECQDYATISHVWSDGYGNPDQNQLWRCQLAYFRDLLKEAQMQKNRQNRGEAKDDPLPFWIDTLTIPVQDQYKSARKKAITHIYKVYSRARYTIVIDNGLNNMSWDDKDYTTTAMRILASGWMRRLWTLQEAYLSRKLLFAFKRWDNNKPDVPLVDLDEIEELFVDTNEALVSSLPANARSYYHNMLGQDRKARIHGLTSTNSVGLVASVWKAAQWRTTSKLEHETLALATLLNLDYQNSSFAGAELLKKRDDKAQKLKEYMRDFWLVLEENSPGAIPPGIIFLPGERIQLPGFGWAPLSWMEAQGVDYPDPISVISKSAKLEPRKGGLLVEFPGFLLHFQDRNAILGYTDGKGFWFPSDSSLSEWYHVERPDGKQHSIKKGIIDERRTEHLAIILSRPRPREIAEIGLLVEIHKTKEQRELGKDSGKRIFGVYIVGRVSVRRETDEKQVNDKRKEIIESRNPEYRERIICGEALEEDQQWYVDSRTTIDEEMGEESNLPTRSASEVNIPATGRFKPYPMRSGAEVPMGIDPDGGASRAGTETPTPAPSTHTAGGSSMHNPHPPAGPGSLMNEKNAVEETEENNVPSPGNLLRSRTEAVTDRVSSWWKKLGRSSTFQPTS